MADLAVLPDDGRALNHHAVLDDCSFADKHVIADDQFRQLVQAVAEADGDLAVEADLPAQDDAALAHEVGELFQPEPGAHLSALTAEQRLVPCEAQEPGEPKLIAPGSEYEVPMSLEVEGQSRAWRERRLVVRSVRHAEAAAVALRARVAKAKAQVEALNLRGRGRQRFEAIAT